MKKAILIFLLLQVITNNTFAEELCRLPALFTHYRHHTTEHHDQPGFVDFLYKHYALADNDLDDEHHGLPFKHCGGCCITGHNAPICSLPSFTTDFSADQTGDNLFSHEDERIQSLELCSIWQPPKLA